MKPDAIVEQSKQCYRQWAPQWRQNAKINSQLPMKSSQNLKHSGIGKAILCVANGYSFEESIDVIVKNHKNVDIICCDKTLGHLIRHGIKPTYCFVADANVNYEKYMRPFERELDQTILLMNVCGNPLWSCNGNWKDRYFFAFKDVMGYEKEFCEISGCQNVITAGTNVSTSATTRLARTSSDTTRSF